MKILNKTVYPYGQCKALEIIGKFGCDIKIGSKKTRTILVVMYVRGNPLLSYDMAIRLGILKIGLEIQVNNVEIKKKYIELFEGIGKLTDF